MFNPALAQAARSRLTLALALLATLWINLALPPAVPAQATGTPAATNSSSEPVVRFDLTHLFKLDLNDERQRRRFWDESHLAFALEGLVNRDQPRLFIRYLSQPDDFWWRQMTQPGGWLAGREIVRVNTLDELLKRFSSRYHGAVLWDEHVPATANLASTIAGCDDLLPVRFDARPDSLCQRLTTGPDALPVKMRLLRNDGTPLFTGTGLIPGTTTPSSGSAKCDAYLWLIDNYVRTGKANPQCLGYYLDAYWLNCWRASAPANCTLCNQDFVIARRGVMFDLGVWSDEAPVDDPGQPPGGDPETLKKLLRAAYDRIHGDGIIQVAGFIPWAYKYTSFRNAAWFAGGKHDGVPTEWHYAEILSCFNACMDADALGLSAMANASFYQHYPLAARYPQNPKPTRETLAAQGLLDASGRMTPHQYVAIYVGDYDSAAWLYHELPAMWRDPARGTLPLSWAFDPNLGERFPLGLAWAREHATANDWFVAGDSGAGYLNPARLSPPRIYSGLPSGLGAWEKHCARYYRQWDISLTGFIIDGDGPQMKSAGLDAYARFSPDGIVAYQPHYEGIHGNLPYLKMCADIDGSPAEAARDILKKTSGSPHHFFVFRSILKTPTWHAKLEQQLHQLSGDDIKVVDLYTLMWLVRHCETNAPAG